MFIYEKNKRNSETGKLEQTLNITFEGNKPVENPDVIIDKDGVTGIKSDSNAYIGIIDGNNPDISMSSYRIDGDLINFSGDYTAYMTFPITFRKSIGFSKTSNDNNYYMRYATKQGENINCTALLTKADSQQFYIQEIGEYIFDIENKIIHTPSKDYNFSEFSDGFNESINNNTCYCIFFVN